MVQITLWSKWAIFPDKRKRGNTKYRSLGTRLRLLCCMCILFFSDRQRWLQEVTLFTLVSDIFDYSVRPSEALGNGCHWDCLPFICFPNLSPRPPSNLFPKVQCWWIRSNTRSNTNGYLYIKSMKKISGSECLSEKPIKTHSSGSHFTSTPFHSYSQSLPSRQVLWVPDTDPQAAWTSRAGTRPGWKGLTPPLLLVGHTTESLDWPWRDQCERTRSGSTKVVSN